ncbi:MAG: response regulator [Myxococcota bacterium]
MSKARILAVDDQRYFRELIEGLLSEDGFDVRTASTGEEALHLLEREDFEIVITDLVMPGMDGSELVRKIKERRPEQEIIMVTGVVDVKSAVDAMKQGATDYILKPFDRPALTRSIDKILQRRGLRDEHARLIEENLEFMGVLSLFERAMGLFATLAVEPLAERLIEGLCLETRAQSGVLWVAEDRGSETLSLVGARGLVRVEGEPQSLTLDDFESAWCPGLGEGHAKVAALPEDADAREALYVPVRAEGVIIGVARLADRLHGDGFTEADRSMAEKFCEFGGLAMNNAMRFRALERRSLRDPDTRAYTRAYFDDAARNEIQKANRFGHRFSILRVDASEALDEAAEDPGFDRLEGERGPEERRRLAARAEHIEAALRGTDLLASDEDGVFYVLMPQTDALGAGLLAQRIQRAFAEGDADAELGGLLFASATYPTDGTQLEGLTRILGDRISQASGSLLASRPELAQGGSVDRVFDQVLELGSVEDAAVEGQILRFVLEDIVRRPNDRGMLFISPGARWLPDLLETLHEVRGQTTRTEIVLLAEGEEREAASQVTWVAKSSIDSRRPFAVYFGDGPAYAMIGQGAVSGERTPLFQSADRAFVEHLAFQLQRELGILIAI